MHWDQALAVFVPWFAMEAFGLFVLIRIATRAGFGVGMAMLFAVGWPLGLVVLAFVEWPVTRQLRAMEALRRSTTRVGRGTGAQQRTAGSSEVS